MVLESNTLDVLFVKDGQQGEDGKILYTWIKYAKDANGTGMTDDPNGAIYIGISYNNESSIESNDPTQYAWTKIQGADGKKGEDAYTIFLENENISFATDKNRNPLSEQAYTSGITIMKGAKPVTDFTIGDIAKTQGIAVAKTDTAIAISVVNGNPLPNDSGEIEIPITVGGTVFKKVLTWTCAKKGEQGEQGERGLQGIQGPQGIQGVAGKDGTNGKTTYFHIKYSSVANPTSSSQLTETPSTYIGTYVDFTETDSTDPKKYTWSQFVGSQGPKGEQGIAGVGVDGKTSYLHIAYANSADGKTGFSASDSTNKSYIGQYTDFTPNDSTDYTKYSWSLIRGKDGTDGVSPTVSVTKNGTTTTITITDKNGTHTQTVKDGTNGTPGTDGKDGKTSYFHVKYSNDGGKTFTGNSGENTGIYMGSYTDYTEADSTDVKKYNWVKVKGDKGDTGQKGQDGTSVKITSKSVTYQTSTSGTTAPTGTWSITVPTVADGQYLWTKTTVQYSDGNKTEAYGVSYKGTNGTNGTSVTVSKTEVTYQVSVSGTTAPTGVWSTTMPSCDQGQYLWTKTYVKYSDGKETTSYSVSYKGVDGEKFSWNLIKYGKGDVKKGFFKNFNKVENGYGELTLTSKKSYQGLYISDGFVVPTQNYPVGSKLIWSYDIMYTKWDFPTGTNHQEFWLGQRYANAPSGETATGQWTNVTSHALPVVGQNGCELNKWLHVEAKVVVPEKASDNVGTECKFQFYNSGNDTATVTLRMKNVKLEYGDTATPWSPAQSDLEGRGVSETVQYYLATSQATGVTSSTSGWSTDITTQKITATKKYLWNCSQTRYTDGTSEPITTPTIIGAYGDKGETGADGQDGAGFHWNLLKYSGDLSQMSYGKAGGYIDTQEFISDASTPSKNVLKSTITTVGNGIYIQGKYLKKEAIKKGNTYTVSAWCKCSSAKDIGVMNVEFLDKKVNISMPKLSTEWQQYIITGVANKDVTATSTSSAISFYYGSNMNMGDILYISSPKVEEGDKASPWCTTYEETLAKSITITPSAQIFKSTDGGNTFAPNQITIAPTLQGDITFGKWQYSIDGGVSFVDVVSGQSGLSVDANKKLTVTKTSGLFNDTVTMVTFRAVASDSSFYDTCSIAKLYDVTDIGDGRNLLWNSNFANTDTTINNNVNSWGFHTRNTNITATIDKTVQHNGFNTLKAVSASNGDNNSGNDMEWYAYGISEVTSDNHHKQEANYTLSFYAKSSISTQFIVRWGYDAYGDDTKVTLTTDWEKYEIKLHRALTSYSRTIIFKLLTASTVYFSEFKLEKGSSATGYSTAPEDVQTAILSTKNSIENVSQIVDSQKKQIEDKVSKTTYETDLELVKGDLSKANGGLNKWRYEIYPKSLFKDEDQSKYTIDIFATNTNLVPSQTVLLDDAKLTTNLEYGDNYIAYALTFIEMSVKKDVTTKMFNDDDASLYVNGNLVSSHGADLTGHDVNFTLAQGWNCIEVVLNEYDHNEGFRFSTVLSNLSECQVMNCYYGTPVARQSRITNQLVDVTKDLSGVNGTVQNVMTVLGGSGKFDDFKSQYNTWKDDLTKSVHTIGENYVTKDDFDGLEIGGRNLLYYSSLTEGDVLSKVNWQRFGINNYTYLGFTSDGIHFTTPSSGVSNSNGISFVINRKACGLKTGDTVTFSAEVKGTIGSGEPLMQYWSTTVSSTNFWDRRVFGDSLKTVQKGTYTKYSVTVTLNDLHSYISDSEYGDRFSVGGGFNSDLYIRHIKLEKGNKATDYTPAPEDDEINGQNLVSNLPDNWEQKTVNQNAVTGSVYSAVKVSSSSRIATKELIPISGNITLSTMSTQNSNKKNLLYYVCYFDVNKKYLGTHSSDWATFPRTIDVGDARYMAIALSYEDSSAIQPSDISKICLKIERGTSATPFTLAPEDVNGKIVNVETIANQTAKKFEWIVKGGDKSSSMVLTDDFLNIVANNINLTGKVTFNSLSSDAKNEIEKVAQSKVDDLDVGGRNLLRNSGKFLLSGTTTGADYSTGTWRFAGSSTMTKSHVEISDPPKSCQGVTGAFQAVGSHPTTSPDGECIGMDGFPYFDEEIGSDVVFSGWARVVGGGDNCYFGFSSYMITFSDGKLLNNYNCIKLNTDGSWTRIVIHGKTTKKVDNIYCGFLTGTESVTVQACGLKLEKGNKATDWTPAPEDVSQDATNKANQALTDAKNYSSNAVNWVTSNGSSTTSLNSMVKKWTDGAVSDTTQVNGGWIKANTITASKIAIGDFTNYCQLNKDTASSYGFTATDDTKGVWFTASPINRDKDISQWFTCEGSQKLYVEYDLSTTVKGKVNASDTGTSYLTSGIMIFVANGTKEIISYTRSKGVTATSDGTVTHISLVETLPSDARFFRVVLQTDGERNTFSGTLKIRDPQVRKATTGKLIVDGAITADKIATDAIKSRNYISSGGTQGSFLNLSDGSFKSPNLSWDSNGNLIAKNANLSGKIKATTGKIGLWTLDGMLYDYEGGLYSEIAGEKSSSVWAYDGNYTAYNFATCSYQQKTGFYFIIDASSLLSHRTAIKDNKYWSGACSLEAMGIIVSDSYYEGASVNNNASDESELGNLKSYTKYFSNNIEFVTTYSDYGTSSFEDLTIKSSIYQNYEALNIVSNSMLLFNPTRTSLFSTSDPSKYNAIETTGDAIIGGNCLLRDRSNGSHKIGIYPYDGCIEMYGNAPYIDFHYGSSTSDYTSRIIAQKNWDCLSFTGSIELGADLYAYGYIYNSSGGHYTWNGRTDAYISCGNYNNTNNIYYYAGYHAFYVNGDSGSGMMYIETSGVSSRKGFRNSSDERIKQNFSHFDDNFIDTYMNLEPVQYQFKNDTNDKYHFGFKAQQTERILNAYGQESDKSYGICTTHAINPEKAEKLYGVKDMHEEYTLAYDELIAPTTYMVQHTYKELESTKNELTKVKQEKADLETRLQAIEAKLGL